MHIPRFNFRGFRKPVGLSFVFALMLASTGLNAQCLVDSLDVSTGVKGGALLPFKTPDPHWRVVNKTVDYFGTPPPLNSSAEVVGFSGWASSSLANWLCDSWAHVYSIPDSFGGSLTFERSFTLCDTDLIDIKLKTRADGYIGDILVDGVSAGSAYSQSPTTISWSGSSLTWDPPPIVMTLLPGVHTLTVVLNNPQWTGYNPGGLLVNGRIRTMNYSIVDDQNSACEGYECPPPPPVDDCDDKCFWKLNGNNINPGHNVFGTLTNDDIRIVTNGASRGVMKGGIGTSGGYFGWNTAAPTARLHINCMGGNNPERAPGLPSDIRFEQLESGQGNFLVIDPQGYVYDSKVPAPSAPEGMMAMKQEIRELKTQLAELRTALAQTRVGDLSLNGNTIEQNTPNPFNQATTIRYNIGSMTQSAAIIVYDLNGKELKKYPISAKGAGEVRMNSESLTPGMYLYSLIVDGQEVATRRMVLTQ